MKRCRFVCELAAFAGIVFLATSAGGTGAEVSLPGEAPLPQALAAVRSATGRLIVSEPVLKERRTDQGSSAQPLAAAVDRLARSYDLRCLERPRILVFNRCFRDSLDDIDLEMEELKACGSDLDRLIQGFAPYPLGLEYIRDKNNFAKSLTTEQMQQMAKDGLPFTRLSPEQQRHWLRLNAAVIYSSMSTEFERLARVFSRWDECSLTSYQNSLGQTAYSFMYPETPESRGDGLDLPPGGEVGSHASAAESEHGVAGERLPGLPPSFDEKLVLEEGEVSLGDAVSAIERATGNDIEIPSYARARKLLVYGRNARAGDLAVALEDLYGWQLRPLSGRRWKLDRPRLVRPTDPRALHRAFLAALPTSVRLVLVQDRFSGYARRYRRQHAELFSELDRAVKPGWTRLAVNKMPDALQRRLANMVLMRKLHFTVANDAARPEPHWFLVAPQEGWFTLEGAPSPEAHPVLHFWVRQPDGKVGGWGWAIGTSTLKE